MANESGWPLCGSCTQVIRSNLSSDQSFRNQGLRSTDLMDLTPTTEVERYLGTGCRGTTITLLRAGEGPCGRNSRHLSRSRFPRALVARGVSAR